ncbi:hypothetical protein BGZ47_006278 [Haplosporangium gracile]|nr:hypothetical protein BGZ47_006278 [Haplosporangium gracile]
MLLHSSSASLCSQQSAPTSSAANYHKLVATLTSSQKPYGTIPRRRRNRASSTATITFTSPASRSSQSSSRNSLELLPTTTSLSNSTTLPLPHPASSTTTTIWASLKAHYFATAQSFSWSTSSSTLKSSSTSVNNKRRSTDCAREFLPPLALLVANSSPVVTLDATPLILTSSEANDISTEEYNNNLEEGPYPASVAAMDKFKVMRSDTIALKTFTYRETPVVEIKRPRTPLLTQRRRPVSIPRPATAVIATAAASTPVAAPEEELLPLPRHLACRETRSNSDYLRMMASELRMIRARKLIAPLKPRSYLPRRRELFSPVKSSLSASMEMTCEDDDHPLNNLLVGSWTSFSSTESFLSSTSSSYATADESFD